MKEKFTIMLLLLGILCAGMIGKEIGKEIGIKEGAMRGALIQFDLTSTWMEKHLVPWLNELTLWEGRIEYCIEISKKNNPSRRIFAKGFFPSQGVESIATMPSNFLSGATCYRCPIGNGDYSK